MKNMFFKERSKKSEKLIEIFKINFWDKVEQYGIFHEPYGYETHISVDVQNILKKIYTKTALHVRFTPDYIVGNSEDIFLLEYKVTTTPKFILKEQQWYFGQVEADAWDNYLNLIQAGINVAVFIYCSYHPRPFLCDIPSFEMIEGDRKSVKNTVTGSRTDYYNLYLSKMSNFANFMNKFFSLPQQEIEYHLNIIKAKILKEPILQTTHAKKSPYNNFKYKTGFNWK